MCVVIYGTQRWYLEITSWEQCPLNISYFLAGSDTKRSRVMPRYRRDEKLTSLPAFLEGTNILCEGSPENSLLGWHTVFISWEAAQCWLFSESLETPCFLCEGRMSAAVVLQASCLLSSSHHSTAAPTTENRWVRYKSQASGRGGDQWWWELETLPVLTTLHWGVGFIFVLKDIFPFSLSPSPKYSTFVKWKRTSFPFPSLLTAPSML